MYSIFTYMDTVDKEDVFLQYEFFHEPTQLYDLRMFFHKLHMYT